MVSNCGENCGRVGREWRTVASRSNRAAVTLVELMVAIALTLMVILAVVRVFDLLGGNVTQSRSILEMSARTRIIADQLQNDLSSLTLKPAPPADPTAAPGYLEIVEGVRSERDPDGDGRFLPTGAFVYRNDPEPNPFVVCPTTETFAEVSSQSPLLPPAPPNGPAAIINQSFLQQVYGVLGDTDDLWMGTIRSVGEPFRGRFQDANGNVSQIESPLAEVVWWIEPQAGPPGSAPGGYGFSLVRRLLLILPSLNVNGALPTAVAGDPAQVQQFLAFNDISVRFEGNGRVVANSLADLTNRRNRFAHWFTPFPHFVNRNFLVRSMDRIVLPDGSIGSRHDGSDLITSDPVAFDIRVFDPLAPLLAPDSGPVRYAVTPVDAGYYTVLGSEPLGFGAYVDLGCLFTSGPTTPPFVSHFTGRPDVRSRLLVNPLAPRVYCTWSNAYERDGLDQNGNGLIDEGTNGLDDGGGSLVVDDAVEQETAPPYAQPLRGLELILRMRDNSTQQVRQTSVVADFVTH